MPLQLPAGLPGLADGILLGVLALGLLALTLARSERRVLSAALAVVAGCTAVRWAGFLLLAQGLAEPGEWLRVAGTLGGGAAALWLLLVTTFRVALPRAGVQVPRLAQEIVLAVGVVLWLLVWLRLRHVNLTGLLATSAVVSAVAAFATRDTLGNLMGGLAIQLDRSVCVGDWLRVHTPDGRVVDGRVAEVRWRYTALETRTWETLIIPNSLLLREQFMVIGRRQGEPVAQRHTVEFNVDFRYAPARVVAVVTAALRESPPPGAAADPPPDCQLLSFEESYARYGARYWLADLDRDEPNATAARTVVYNALRREGIPLSMPAQAVFLTSETGDRKRAREAREAERRAAALAAVPLFAVLREEEVAGLAARLSPAPFGPGEAITRQGAPADCLFLVTGGYADVYVAHPDGHTAHVAEVGPGEVIGEMGLMTGEPRAATVLARTEVEAWRLDRAAFQVAVRSRPGIAEEISAILARRRLELDAALEELDAEARAGRLRAARRDLLTAIRRYFGLGEEPRRG